MGPGHFEKELCLRKLFVELIDKKKDKHSNVYPEFPFFFEKHSDVSLGEVKKLWQERIEEVKNEANDISLILSIPFCRSRCEYCSHYRWSDKQTSEVDTYVRLLVQEMRSYKDIFNGIQFKRLQVMGGSPSRLTEKQIGDVLVGVHENFDFEKDANQYFDFNPKDSSLRKMQILADHGINGITFGVQSLDPEVLRWANRGYQDYDTIKKAVRDVREFPSLTRINVEMLIGLWNDTPQTVLETFVKLAKLKIDLVRVYRLSPNPSYVKKYYNNSKEIFDRQLEEKIRIFEKSAAPVAKDLGYRFISISEDYPDQESLSFDFLLEKHDPTVRRKYNFRKGNLNLDCLGIGVDSESKISNVIYYKNDGFTSLDKETNGLEVMYRAAFSSINGSKFAYIVKMLENNTRLSTIQYKGVFGTDIRDDFKVGIRKLQRLRALTISGDVLSLTAKAKKERLIWLLFFIDNKTVLSGIDRCVKKRSGIFDAG